jgi:hypothetical protein
VQVAFDVLELDDVISHVDGNAAPRAVVEKLGMTYERDIEHAGLPHVVSLQRASGNMGRGSRVPC